MRVQFVVVAGLTIGALLVAGCDSGGSAVATRDRAAETAGIGRAAEGASAQGAEDLTASAAKPVVTANRRETVDEKITRLYERNGAAFGARSAEEYLSKLEAFVANPPRDAESVRRPNGDTLHYQASTNTFVVIDQNGVARTMFKPDDGATYWSEQKSAAPTFGQQRRDN